MKKIPVNQLPKDYKKIGAEKFGKSEEQIKKVVSGRSRNDEIFFFFLELAEKRKKELEERITALQQ
jgi:argininosuccinate lyase